MRHRPADPAVSQDCSAPLEAAAQGVAGVGTALPHLEPIQRAFGPEHDLSRVQAHVGGPTTDACERMGASAFATGAHVGFKAEPTLHEAAHEAAHVVQQSQGVQLYGGVGQDGDAYEKQADAVADRVVAGQSVADVLGPSSRPLGDGGQVQQKGDLRAEDDDDDLRYLVDTLIYYVGCLRAGTNPTYQRQGDAALGKIADGILSTCALLIGGTSAESAFAAQDRVNRSAHDALDRYARLANHDANKLQDARDALALLENTVASRTAESRVVAGADSADVVSPEEGFYSFQSAATVVAIDKMFDLHRRALDTILRLPDSRMDTAASAKLDDFTANTQHSLKFLRGVHSVLVQGPKIIENLEKAHQQGVLTEIGTIAELFSEATKAIRDLGESITALLEAVTKSSLPAVAKAAKALGKEFSKLTAAVGVLQIIGNVFKLIEAIENGDDSGIGQSVHGILQGTWTIAAWALRLGTGATALVSLTIFLWHEVYQMMGRLGGILGSLKAERGLRALKKFVDVAGTVARSGQHMSSAMGEFVKTANETHSSSPELQQRLLDAFERIAAEEAKKVQLGLRQLKHEATSMNHDDVGAYPHLIQGFPQDILAQASSRDPLADEPLRLAEQCNVVFRAIDTMSKVVLSETTSTDLWVTGGT